jgi:predicted AAA+ superfamily ATPase
MKVQLPKGYAAVLAGLPRWTAGAPFTFESLKAYYMAHGAGLFSRYQAFLWQDGILTPVPDPDCMGPEALRGYESQREEVLANPRALLEGRQVNNVLLYGDSGTGKSVTVKSPLAVPEFRNLRLIEVEKEGLSDLPHLIRTLGGRRQKFILFIDDLTFDKDDRTYSTLKTILEGGLEKRPVNVAIYDTSNRRNLVRQTFSDREGDEVDLSETIQEKTSLAERFGLRIPYLSMSKPEFLSVVEELAAVQGISMDREKLRAEAVKWEMHHPGRTPRTARQFIMSLAVTE